MKRPFLLYAVIATVMLVALVAVVMARSDGRPAGEVEVMRPAKKISPAGARRSSSPGFVGAIKAIKTGYMQTDDGQVSYGIIFKNTSRTHAAEPLKATVFMSDANNRLLASRSYMQVLVPAGATAALGDSIIIEVDEDRVAHVAVKFEATPRPQRAFGSMPRFSFDRPAVQFIRSETKVTGRIRSDFARPIPDMGVDIIFLNSRDEIVGGAQSPVGYLPARGSADYLALAPKNTDIVRAEPFVEYYSNYRDWLPMRN